MTEPRKKINYRLDLGPRNLNKQHWSQIISLTKKRSSQSSLRIRQECEPQKFQGVLRLMKAKFQLLTESDFKFRISLGESCRTRESTYPNAHRVCVRSASFVNLMRDDPPDHLLSLIGSIPRGFELHKRFPLKKNTLFKRAFSTRENRRR